MAPRRAPRREALRCARRAPGRAYCNCRRPLRHAVARRPLHKRWARSTRRTRPTSTRRSRRRAATGDARTRGGWGLAAAAGRRGGPALALGFCASRSSPASRFGSRSAATAVVSPPGGLLLIVSCTYKFACFSLVNSRVLPAASPRRLHGGSTSPSLDVARARRACVHCERVRATEPRARPCRLLERRLPLDIVECGTVAFERP